MGSLHNELKRGPWGSAISGVVGLSRDASGLERLGETLTPIIDIWSPARPDWAIERREQLVFLHGFQAAVAGELSCIVFDASVDANTILIIDRLLVTAAAVLIGIDARPAGATESTNKDFMDHRVRAGSAANRRPRSRVWTDSNAATAVTGPLLRYNAPGAAITGDLPGPFVLIGDNLSLIVEHQTVNTAIHVTAIGRERQLLPAEAHDNP